MELTIHLFWFIGFLGNAWMMSLGLGLATQQDWVDAYGALLKLADVVALLLERLSYDLARLLF